MRPETRLDSAVFQLTPTRTRCELVIIANGKTEKIASGLLTPFLAHLKTAQDQIAKGGYSITLEPGRRMDAVWFTKGTIERFVRFVSTPEVLERVNTIESEILQIDEAISIQGNENLGLSTLEDYNQTRSTECFEGSKPTVDADSEKAIVLYKPGSHINPQESNSCTTQEENSKVQLLRVLETRTTVLQKEQGMAFARAAAAGFDMDNMVHLISFAECFGASRLMEACLQYMELWKRKHETGQWLEVEAAEEMFSRSEFASKNASGIILSGDTREQKEFGEAWPVSDLDSESNIKPDQRYPSDSQLPSGPHEYFQGQFQHTTFPQWAMHAPPGLPMYQPYPVQGMPYYQSYPGNGPFFQPPYPPMEDPRFNGHQRTKLKRHSLDSKDGQVESESSEMGASSTRSQDSADQRKSEFEKETSQDHVSRKMHGRSGKKQSGVVIHNINYITSKSHETLGSESQSASETEEENEDSHSDAREGKHKKSSGPLKKKEGSKKSLETSNTHDKDKTAYLQEADSGNWQAFQSFLLRAEEKMSTITGDIIASEKEPPIKKRPNKNQDDLILLPERDSDVGRELRMAEFDSVNGKASRIKQVASNDEFLLSGKGRNLRDSHLYSQFKEIEGGGGGYRSTTSDDFIIYGQGKQIGNSNSSDPLAEHKYEHAGNFNHRSSYIATDESFIVPFRSGTQDQLGADGRPMNMDSEFPSAVKKITNLSSGSQNQLNFEPYDLTLVPERGMDGSSGYDPARDYDIQIPVDNAVKLESRNQDVPLSTREGSLKTDNGKKSKVPQNGLDKRKTNMVVRKGAFSKLNPLSEAQKRAQKLRAFKADLQKEKKEKEEEEIRRLEALRKERQKRIAARSSSTATQSSLTPKQIRAPLPTKVSPSSYKGSKFSDSEPGSSSPIPKLPIRTASIGSVDLQKMTKTSRINGSTNGLSRSVSSLPELKKESNGLLLEAKTASIRNKRFSDPKGSSLHRASLVKPVTSDQVPKKNILDNSQTTKISAIMQLDKTKSATLPELRMKTSKAPSAVQKSSSKATLQKVTGSKTSLTSESVQAKKSNEKPPRLSNIDDNPIVDPVIEKTVVMLENVTFPVPVVPATKEINGTKYRSHRDGGREKTTLDSEFEAIPAPPSSIIVSNDGYYGESKLHDQLNSSEVVFDYSKDESQKSSNFPTTEKSYQAPYARATSLEDPATSSLEVVVDHSKDESLKSSNSRNSTTTEKPYQAPYARVTSLEDPATSSLRYSETPPVVSSEMATTVTDSDLKARVPNSVDASSMEQSQEMYEKPRSKESKGFRKLLKFGRKSHSSASGETNLDSDASVVDDTIESASNDVHILKNLISQDDAHVGGTPPKVSRPFSLLSPFRNKTSEKKLALV